MTFKASLPTTWLPCFLISTLLISTLPTVFSKQLTAQKSLTKQELEILEKINTESQDAKPTDDGARNNNLLYDIRKSITLETDELDKLDESIGYLENLVDTISEQYVSLYQQFEALVRDDVLAFNVQQLNQLKDKISKSREAEIERRHLQPEHFTARTLVENLILEETVESDDDDDDDNDEEDEQIFEEGVENSLDQEEIENEDIVKVTKKHLEERLLLSRMTESFEDSVVVKMEEFIPKAIPTEIVKQFAQFEADFQQKKLELTEAKNLVKQIMQDSEKMNRRDDKCMRHTSALNMVQMSIWEYDNDGGVYDHLSNGGAVVVHGDEWTSASYSPLDHKDYGGEIYERVTLREYQDYIPEDWIRLLPDGWEDTDLTFIKKFLNTDPRKQIPTSVWHSIPRPLMKLLSPPGKSIAVPKPPETIMSKNNHLGSCWAMSGSSGKITLRLREPMSIKSVTVDHYPGLPSAHNETNMENINRSAPRFVRVMGYPPCEDANTGALDCIKLGFESTKGIHLGSFEYKPVPSIGNNFDNPRRSSQTFILRTKPLRSTENQDGIDNQESEELGGGSCSATKASCEGEVDANDDEESGTVVVAPVVASLSFVIEENWGNKDFTCLYRIRVHE